MKKSIKIGRVSKKKPAKKRHSKPTGWPSVEKQVAPKSAVAAAEPVPMVDDQPIECPLCDFKSKWVSSVRKHYQRNHTSDDFLSVFNCGGCGFRTFEVEKLEHHLTQCVNAASKPTNENEDPNSSTSESSEETVFWCVKCCLVQVGQASDSHICVDWRS